MTTDKKTLIHAGETSVCAHQIFFFFRISREITEEEQQFLNQEVEDRAKAQIPEGYIQGELNYESENLSCRGWWKIED